MRALRAVTAVLGASSRLDAQKRAELHFARIVMGAMSLLGLEEQVWKGCVVTGADFIFSPVVPQRLDHGDLPFAEGGRADRLLELRVEKKGNASKPGAPSSRN
jgi:hypothetical protein